MCWIWNCILAFTTHWGANTTNKNIGQKFIYLFEKKHIIHDYCTIRIVITVFTTGTVVLSGVGTVILKSTVPCLILGYIPYVGSSNTYTKNYNNPQRRKLPTIQTIFWPLVNTSYSNVMHFFTISTIDCNAWVVG